MSDEIKLSLIPHEYASELWPHAAPYIERAVEPSEGLVTAEAHRRAVVEGHKQLWLLTTPDGSKVCGAGITEIINHDICFIWALGGDQMKLWWETQDVLEQYARDHHCTRIEFFGRKGWARALRNRNYKERLVVLAKELRP